MSENNGEINPIIVFSCRNCGVIIGDSLCLVCTNGAMQIVTLSGGHKLQRRDHQTVTSREAFDAGSTYSPVHCQGCNFLLGRYYLTTSRALSQLLDNYTLNVADLTTYDLGTVTVGEPLPKTDPQVGPTADQQEELVRVQHVLVDLALRLQRVEAELAEYNEPSSARSSATMVLASTSSHPPAYSRSNREGKGLRQDGSRELHDDTYWATDRQQDHLPTNSQPASSSNDSGIKRPRR